MRINFRQGIVSHQNVFLTLNGILGTVSLVTTNKPTIVTIAHRTTNYIHSENNSVSNAWTGIVNGVNSWLYWDFNLSNFSRTFGRTNILPVFGPTAPPLPANGQIWYDTVNKRMFERDGLVWREVLRVFAAFVQLGAVLLSMSINAPLFTGTQVGITTSVRAGRVLFDESSRPIRRTDGTFFTSEDQFFTSAARIDALRLESNVSFAQSAQPAIAQFTIVAYDAAGKIRTALYDDISNTVLAVLSEDILQNEVGSTIIQGVVTNVAWSWTNIGKELWVDNGLLVEDDPHAIDNITFPIGRVPVARVLSSDTVVFEQGLGSKGDQGPEGVFNLSLVPNASTTVKGLVLLTTPPTNPLLPIAVSDTDPRLTDARTPLPHFHSAINISFSPTGTIAALNVQGAIEELGVEKVAKAGDIMAGFLTLHANPINTFHAATKNYVDAFGAGLVWLDPIKFSNLISDALNTPPAFPQIGDVYIVAPGGAGAWTGLSGRIVEWNGTNWLDRGLLSAQSTGARFGISFDTTTTPSGTFAGFSDRIFTLTNPAIPTWTIAPAPITGNAVFINNDNTLNAFHQYVYTGTKWVEFGGPQPLTAGINLIQVGNTLNVVNFGAGGTIDAEKLQGFVPGDFSLVGHTHPFPTASQISNVPAIGSNFGTPAVIVDIASTDVQAALNELLNQKAEKTPLYTVQANFPSAATVHGMLVVSDFDDRVYFSHDGTWEPLANQSDITGLVIPYDLTFFVGGTISASSIVSSTGVPRSVFVSSTNPHVAVCNTAPATTTVIFDIQRRISPYALFTNIGTVTFSVGVRTGVVVITSSLTINATDLLQIKAPGSVDVAIQDVSITIIGCSAAPGCSLV